jgi:hypothetical protein
MSYVVIDVVYIILIRFGLIFLIRFDGTLGQIPVMFDRVYGQHLEVKGPE